MIGTFQAMGALSVVLQICNIAGYFFHQEPGPFVAGIVYGLTLAAVRDFTSDGRPNLLVKDIPPRSEAEELQVTSPQIYYGELTGDPVVVNSSEPEFDYPSGDENVSTFYAGRGGVELRNLWRKFLLGWRFDGTRFFFSTYMTPDTRVTLPLGGNWSVP